MGYLEALKFYRGNDVKTRDGSGVALYVLNRCMCTGFFHD